MHRRQTLLSALLLALLVLVLAGCERPGGKVVSPVASEIEGPLPASMAPSVPKQYANGNADAGKAAFLASGCNACHTLADAGAKGTIGPDLDSTKPILATVVDRVVNGKGTMPPFKGRLTDVQISDVSAYVVKATAG